MTRNFLTTETVIVIHDILIEETGGGAGLRDVGALESAIMRPQIGYYDGFIEEAAALMESLAVNHPFMDGNKRIAFAAADCHAHAKTHLYADAKADCNARPGQCGTGEPMAVALPTGLVRPLRRGER